ncbi:helix-turn-helix domain-containing protein [Burkholderia sp. 9120]|uniref:helix-turn-helix transcriptional regulator n=1 Tax=Burkholderia sp. 9120 TaxID=1500897 RepID=UPI00054E540C|nr:helix-turn-helix domain-containing protein [Burkholderia sp. 9120]
MPLENGGLPPKSGDQRRPPHRIFGSDEPDYTRKPKAPYHAAKSSNGTSRKASTNQARAATKKTADTQPSPRLPKAADQVSAGLVIVCIHDHEISDDVRNAFEMEVMVAGEQTGLAMPNVEYVLSLRSGGPSASSDAKASTAAENIPEDAAERRFEFYGPRASYNFFCNEGLDALQQAIEGATGNCVTVAVTASSPSDRYFIDTLARVRTTAVAANTYVIAFVGYEESGAMPELDDFCERYLEVETCEPGPGAQDAFSIAIPARKRLQKRGIGKVMCSVDYVNDRCDRSYERFIAASVKDRFIWELAAHRAAYEEIGRILKCSKSTISRHLKSMRKQLGKVRLQKMSDERFEEYLELCEVESNIDEQENANEPHANDADF